ncbi:MAG TPA: cytochrome oxidase small assembly protein [Burkholderiales bacterium]|nr:cytochrome oxidase small assembly protein [Burkholderiales bacterium]
MTGPDPTVMAMSKNLKTALVLGTIALVFFFGIIAKYWLLRR